MVFREKKIGSYLRDRESDGYWLYYEDFGFVKVLVFYGNLERILSSERIYLDFNFI